MNILKDKSVFLETERLILRRIDEQDYKDLCEMLQDSEVMYAWEKTLTDQEVLEWIEKMQKRYELEGYGYFMAVDKNSGEVIGQIGLIKEEVEGVEYVGLGYMLKKKHWGQGFAKEGCQKVIKYAFDRLKVDSVSADIRPENKKSCRVAQSLGMEVIGEWYKHDEHKVRCHHIYWIGK
ncbi:MAG: GNAT family N-acetyltransferase [Turicibacter sp.]